MSRGTGRGTHIFSFEMPSRECNSHSANSLRGASVVSLNQIIHPVTDLTLLP